EIYEKINPETGCGVVVMFANSFGQPWSKPNEATFRYVTKHVVDRRVSTTEGGAVRIDHEGKADITAVFPDAGAVIFFFGVDSTL
ncbi:MAG: hypothetical protein H7X86_14360, partial [Gorillibacterium sp.]|nr:hypothetical protein [Gorillibacterium sp.]